MKNESDINSLYNEIFGISNRPNIFSNDDEGYINLRREIIMSKSQNYDKKQLPFDDVNIISYDEFINNKIVSENAKKRKILSIVTSLQEKSMFHIKIENVCNASGFYDENDGTFYICKGSLIALSRVTNKVASLFFQERIKFICEHCSLHGYYYKVLQDSKCPSPTCAAGFALGKISTFTKWKTNDGKYLYDLYPDKFKRKILNDNLNDHNSLNEHLFFIKRTRLYDRSCDASGYYDALNKNFILLSGSILSLNTTFSFNFAPIGIERERFLPVYCLKKGNGYILKLNYMFSSPGKAASFVLGRLANGWNEWKDKDGYSLKDFIDKN